MDKFDLHTKILIGGDALRSMMQGMHRVFIVTDAFMAKSGRTAYLTDPIEQAGAEYRIYSEVGPDPDINMVTAGVSVIMEFQPDAVIAFGGGSPIDAAKAIMYFAARQTARLLQSRRQAAREAKSASSRSLPIKSAASNIR